MYACAETLPAWRFFFQSVTQVVRLTVGLAVLYEPDVIVIISLFYHSKRPALGGSLYLGWVRSGDRARTDYDELAAAAFRNNV